MTKKENFTQEEWDKIMRATALAGIGLINADKSSLINTIRELIAYASALVQAETEYKSNDLLGIIIQELRDDDGHYYHKLQASALFSREREKILTFIEEATDILQKRVSDLDLSTYKHFLIALLTKIAETVNEGILGTSPTAISPQEQEYLDKVEHIFS